MTENGNGHYGARIPDLPALDRPRERLRDAGASALGNPELLAILLRTGSSKESAIAQAQRILSAYTLDELRTAPFAELCRLDGIGEAKAAQIKAALELGVRFVSQTTEARRQITSPEELTAPLLAEMSVLPQEEVRVFLLDSRNRLISEHRKYQGTVHAAHVRIAELLQEAVRIAAPAMALVHNHPSQDPMPSAADIQMTKQLCEAARLMDIEVLDHVVIGGGRFASINNLQPQLFAKVAR